MIIQLKSLAIVVTFLYKKDHVPFRLVPVCENGGMRVPYVAAPSVVAISREIGRKEAESSAEGRNKLVTSVRFTVNAADCPVSGYACRDE